MPEVGDVASVRLNMELDARPMSIGVYYQYLTVPSVDLTFVQLATEFAQTLNSLEAALSNNILLTSIYVTADRMPNKEAPYYMILDSRNGDIASPALPANNAVIIRFRQLTDPARHDGRVYIPGIAESTTDLNEITSEPTLNNLKAWADSIETLDFGAGAFQWRQVIKGMQPDPAPPGLIEYRDVVGNIVNPTIYTQSRRSSRVHGSADPLPLGP